MEKDQNSRPESERIPSDLVKIVGHLALTIKANAILREARALAGDEQILTEKIIEQAIQNFNNVVIKSKIQI